MSAEVDGIPVPDAGSYRTQAAAFSIPLPYDNILGKPQATVMSPSVDDGVYMLLKPLSPGAHDLHFHGEQTSDSGPNKEIDVTYHLIVSGI